MEYIYITNPLLLNGHIICIYIYIWIWEHHHINIDKSPIKWEHHPSSWRQVSVKYHDLPIITLW